MSVFSGGASWAAALVAMSGISLRSGDLERSASLLAEAATVRSGAEAGMSLPERDRVFTLVYSDRDAAYLKRFTFGGMILDKEYHCTAPKSKILFLAPDTPETLYIRYKPAPYQKVSQQTCNPADIEVRGAKTLGRQISIKDVAAVDVKPPRGWDAEAPTTRLQFA